MCHNCCRFIAIITSALIQVRTASLAVHAGGARELNPPRGGSGTGAMRLLVVYRSSLEPAPSPPGFGRGHGPEALRPP
jgi:hypothetical protein